MRIITVLKTGGDFTEHHVHRLFEQCAKFAPKASFICLSDLPNVPGRMPLKHGWPGWWSKMEMFQIHGPALYMDLDTVVVDDLEPVLEIAESTKFAILRDVNSPNRVQSSIMAWSGAVRRLHSAFLEDPAGHMARNNTPEHWGDQGFLNPLMDDPDIWQDVLPGALVSYKKDCQGRGLPPGARIVFFHGKPRPWEVTEPWL